MAIIQRKGSMTLYDFLDKLTRPYQKTIERLTHKISNTKDVGEFDRLNRELAILEGRQVN